MKVAAKKAERIGIGLVGEFGSESQKRKVAKASRVVNGVDRAFSGGEIPRAKLRAMSSRMPKSKIDAFTNMEILSLIIDDGFRSAGIIVLLVLS